MISSIFNLQIGHSLRFLEHLTHAVLCLQGKYRASLSFSQQIMQSPLLLSTSIFLTALPETCLFTIKVEVVPILKTVWSFNMKIGLFSPSLLSLLQLLFNKYIII